MTGDITTSELIRRCRAGEATAQEQLFLRYRHYLRVLATAQLGRYLRSKCDPSDIVQQTLLEALRDFPRFAGQHEAELLGWMRQILAHNLFNETRRFTAQQRDATREVSLDIMRTGLDHSSAALAQCLAAHDPSPSELATQREGAVRLADQLAELPEDYQTVLILRIFEGLSTEEAAERMDRSAGAVRMLQLRALTALREKLQEQRSKI